MIISYPVLPARQANESEDRYFQRLLNVHVLQGEGRFPISTINTSKGPLHRWHGGIHIAGLGEPIRAMADGTVVAFRFAKSAETYEELGKYDTSFVLIRHETQTGENTTVAFYSLYMHLANRDDLQTDRYQQLPAWMRSPLCTPGAGVQTPINLKVWRKDVLGFAGQLYGSEACHVEVFVTDAQLQAFWRNSANVTSGNGSDDFFGDAHFVVPAQQAFVAKHPRAAATGAHRIDFPGNQDFNLDVGQAGQNDQRLFVTVRLEKGDRIATTFAAKADGSGYVQVGAPVVQAQYEYELYRLATALYPDCPSAGFEWLRFGRVLGSDTTERNENWQLVRYSADAVGYIDLAPQSIAKLSDADFPFWQGWAKCEEGEAARSEDGVCDDPRALAIVNGDDADNVVKARHLLCKAPSEWDASDLALRYARLREPGGPLESEKAWQSFETHVKNMAFWTDAGLGQRSVWHFHPLQFVWLFNRCGWLSNVELARCIPRNSLSDHNLSWTTALSRAQTHGVFLNKYFRKYKGSSRQRQVHALAQIYIETGLLRTVTEDGAGGNHEYGPFYGRAYNQITWVDNYKKFGAFKGFPDLPLPNYADSRITATSLHPLDSAGSLVRWAPRYDPQILATDLTVAADASGFYWVSKSFRGKKNINRVCDLDFSPSSVGFVCWLINGGGAGYANRQQFAQYLANVMLDERSVDGVVNFRYPALTPAGNPALCLTFPPADVPYGLTGAVNHEKQIP
jgi:hypothetical protein